MSSEKEPEYEPKEKIQSKCWNCEYTVRSSLENTTNHLYAKEPWFNHTRLKCLDENCGAVTILFHDEINEKGKTTALQYPTTILEFLDSDDDDDWESIKEIRGKSVGAHDVEPQKLSKRQEDSIAHWGVFLQKIIVDETDFGAGDES